MYSAGGWIIVTKMHSSSLALALVLVLALALALALVLALDAKDASVCIEVVFSGFVGSVVLVSSSVSEFSGSAGSVGNAFL